MILINVLYLIRMIIS